jgi:hypothetical protein
MSGFVPPRLNGPRVDVDADITRQHGQQFMVSQVFAHALTCERRRERGWAVGLKAIEARSDPK